ncbi:Terpene Synthase 9 [Hibiscus trionum]|uniref:Terpene Synthase 9 n=1 Tax=Hibiscus trionum TaxID=183268 RepID=A0A9W7IJU4_HIBTR|nr:Terpene Synthase 9 [Hibiscus trionum]
MQRLGARHYISYYETDETKNDMLLKFAKHDFNRVQMLPCTKRNLASSTGTFLVSRLLYKIVSVYTFLIVQYPKSSISTNDEVEEQVTQEKRSFSISYTKTETKKLVRAYHAQARWTHEHMLPDFDEYLGNGMRSSAVILTLALLMLPDFDEYLGRLYNDVQSYEDEVKRRGQLSVVACYMKEYGVSEKEAVEYFRRRIRAAWKDMKKG